MWSCTCTSISGLTQCNYWLSTEAWILHKILHVHIAKILHVAITTVVADFDLITNTCIYASVPIKIPTMVCCVCVCVCVCACSISISDEKSRQKKNKKERCKKECLKMVRQLHKHLHPSVYVEFMRFVVFVVYYSSD